MHELPYDAERMDVDLPRLAAVAAELRPKLIIVGGSMCLHPYDVRGVRAVADEVGAHVLYDAAHMGGLIAGGRFQQPLAGGRPRDHGIDLQELRRAAVRDDPDRRSRCWRNGSTRSRSRA